MGDNTDDDSMDRISELPVFIVHQIMSNLQSREVAQTSVLSKKWHDLQRSFPILDFDDAYMHFMTISYPIFFRGKRELLRRSIEKFVKYVDTSLVRFCELDYSLQKFKLLISFLNIQESISVLDEWIRLVVERDVKVLDFDIRTMRDPVYVLPKLVFSAKSVISLRLGGCKLELPVNSIRFVSLKSLTLNYVCVSEEMLYRLTSECKWLEELSMLHCKGMKCFGVSKAYKLRIINVIVSSNELESFKIVAPNLQQLLLSSSDPRRRVIEIDKCIEMKTFELVGFNLMGYEFCRLISRFPYLENLKLGSSHSLESFVIASDLLKNLNISTCPDLKTVDIDTPNLVSFIYMDNSVPVSSAIKARCAWKLYLRNRDEPNTSWYVNVKEFIAQSSHIEDLTLHVTSEMISFSFDEFRSSSASALVPCEVGNLCVELDAPTTQYATFLDGVLSICYPKILSVKKARENHMKFVEWLVETMMNGDAASCCNVDEIKCWRHYLSNFKITGFIPSGEKRCYNSDNLMDFLPRYLTGTFQFHLDWYYPEI